MEDSDWFAVECRDNARGILVLFTGNKENLSEAISLVH